MKKELFKLSKNPKQISLRSDNDDALIDDTDSELEEDQDELDDEDPSYLEMDEGGVEFDPDKEDDDFILDD